LQEHVVFTPRIDESLARQQMMNWNKSKQIQIYEQK
jgi:hypothetical protein